MLRDKAGKPLPPSDCHLLNAWVGAWFAANRQVLLVEPSVAALPSDAAAAHKADVQAWLAPGRLVSSWKAHMHHMVDSEGTACLDLIGQREVVLEGGLQQVGGR
jgi:hypothetical protein